MSNTTETATENTESTALAVAVTMDQLPSVSLGSDEMFNEIAKGADFLGRLQLYTKGKAVNKNLVRPGHYGIPVSEDEVIDLGASIDLIPLARRAKAIDMSDKDAIVVSHDPNSENFKEIQERSAVKESSCMYGPAFLVFERTTGKFYELFCGNKSMRTESKKVFPYLSLTQAAIDDLAKKGNDVSALAPHGPIPMTLKSRLVEKGDYSWHVPVVSKCTQPFTKLPSEEVIVKEIIKFITVKDNGVEKVKEEEGKKRRAR